MDLLFSPDASQMLDKLEADPAYDALVEAIWDALDQITEAPDSAFARRRVLRTEKGHSIWMVPVPGRHRENPWVILWRPQNGEALIAYVGPEDFGTR